LTEIIESPFEPVVRNAFRDAIRAIGENGLNRLSYIAEREKFQQTKMEVAAEHASREGIQAAALDILQLMIGWNLDYRKDRIDISDFEFESMSFEEEVPDFSRVTFQECIFFNFFLAPNIQAERLPRFRKCLIGSLDGVATLGDLPKEAFQDCDVLELSNSVARNAGILATDLPGTSKVLLTVLNKLFNQAGRGRKENAFSRGLDPRDRALVPDILQIVERFGFAAPNRIRNETIWFPRRDKLRRVNDILNHPGSSTDPILEWVRTH